MAKKASYLYYGIWVRDESVRWWQFWKPRKVWKRTGRVKVEPLG